MLKLNFNHQVIYCCADMRDYKTFILQLASPNGDWILSTKQQYIVYEQQLKTQPDMTDRLFKLLAYGSSAELQRKRHYISLSSLYRRVGVPITTIYYKPSRSTI